MEKIKTDIQPPGVNHMILALVRRGAREVLLGRGRAERARHQRPAAARGRARDAGVRGSGRLLPGRHGRRPGRSGPREPAPPRDPAGRQNPPAAGDGGPTSSSRPSRRGRRRSPTSARGGSTGGCSAWMAPPSIVGALVGRLPVGRDAAVAPAARVHLGGALLQRVRAVAGSPKPKRAADAENDAPHNLNITAAVVTRLWSSGSSAGIVGLILGSLRMPALLKFVGETPHRAVGTNVTVGFVVGVGGRTRGTCPRPSRSWTLPGDRGRCVHPGRAAGKPPHRPAVRAGSWCARSAGVLLVRGGHCVDPGRNLTRWTCRRRPPTSSAT